ncbi:cytochrome P450 [Novosphingobium lentum]|uniref:cytochrome P450 n=1 Tax=Novosphingobium lentum TaxID=145287 RepID=UPI000837A700|nr:cytochrome P450 [Novosphingobium lentum]
MTSTEPAVSEISRDFAAVSSVYGTDTEDPHAVYRECRKSQPIMVGDILAKWNVPSQADYSNLGRQVFTLFRYDDVLAVLRDNKTFTSTLLQEGLGQFLGGFLLTGMDDATHKVTRKLLAPAFSSKAIAGWKALLTPVVQDAVAKLAPRGKAELMEDLLLPLPVRLIYEIIGFPKDEARTQEFAARGMRILVGPQRDPEKVKASMAAAFVAAQELYDDTLEVVAQRRAEGSVGEDLIGYLLRAEDDGTRLDDAHITELIRQMLPAAAETTTRSFGSMLVALLERPALLARIRDDRTLVAKAVNEGMRWETASQFLARQATVDVEFHGVTVPAGAALSLCSGSANRDETVFDNPDEFDIDRPQKVNVGFGAGIHTCLGMPVAKTEMEAMLNAVLDLPNLRLDPDQPAPVIVGAQLRGPRALHVVWG